MNRLLAAMPAARYKVGIRHPVTRKMMEREWSADELRTAIPWLKRRNLLGEDIYIRPLDTRYVLLDDVTSAIIKTLAGDGLAPAVIVETSAGNFQAWIKLEESPTPEERSWIGRDLAQIYGADRASTDHAHYGRMPGFTNQKREHRLESGFQPYVLVWHWAGEVATKGAELITRARAWLAKRAEPVSERMPVRDAPVVDEAIRTFTREWKRAATAMKVQGQRIDASRCDFIAGMVVRNGGYSQDVVAKCILECSPRIERRKGRPEEYAQRTAEAVERVVVNGLEGAIEPKR